jgi:two-component system sensor histidine kinase BaeS
MSLWARVGLRQRLALALAAVAIVSVALATLLANRGLDSRLDQFARDRLQGAAAHSAQLAGRFYARDGRWTPSVVGELRHLAQLSGYRLTLADSSGRPLEVGARVPAATHASAPVIADDGAVVATASVSPIRGQVLGGEDASLHRRLNRLHLLAAGLALALGLLAAGLLASALARPLRRLTHAARAMQGGDLAVRVAPGGAAEIRQLGQAFNRLAETLEREEQIRRDAAADVAHELRTPLAGIVSRIEAAQDGVMADEHANLEAMHAEALRLSALVEDLGKLAEAQQPGLTLSRQRLDLRALVHERALVYREHMRAKDIELRERLQPVSTYADRGRVVQIVDNLLSNALRYTDAGGTVTLELSERDGEAVLEVSDSGIGIRAEDLPYVFDRFWRAEPSRDRRTGGAGIGLAIVRELVRAHDGRIDVHSTPREGSRFRVTLPGDHADP